MTLAAQSHWRMLAYGLLGLPLAMAALPVYVQIPAYYSSNLGVALAMSFASPPQNASSLRSERSVA